MSATEVRTYHGSYLMRGIDHATVSDAMHPGILSCDPDASLPEVARLMASHRVHCLAVMAIRHEHEHEGDKLVWGIISDVDLLREGIGGGDATASELAEQPIISVEPAMSLRAAGELMLDHDASHVVVIDPVVQRPIGILSTLDIAGALAWGKA